jgi:hypothetical protein
MEATILKVSFHLVGSSYKRTSTDTGLEVGTMNETTGAKLGMDLNLSWSTLPRAVGA